MTIIDGIETDTRVTATKIATGGLGWGGALLAGLLAFVVALGAGAGAGAAAGEECLRAINLAGAEFGEGRGRIGHDYVLPSAATLDHFAGKGMRAVRLPISWPRLQPVPNGDLDTDHLAEIRRTIGEARGRGLRTILDIHSYGRWKDRVVGSPELPIDAFADLWRRLAVVFRGERDVVFGLMNEPHDLDRRLWRDAAQAGVDAVRRAGAGNLVLVPGADWSGAHSWEAPGDATSNAALMATIRDPAGNLAFEVHQYLDGDFSGTSPTCGRAEEAIAALRRFRAWATRTGVRGFLGEIGASDRPECLAALAAALAEVDAHPRAWLGWAYWAAGEWWPPSYPFSVQPTAAGDRPQMTELERSIARGSGRRGTCAPPSRD